MPNPFPSVDREDSGSDESKRGSSSDGSKKRLKTGRFSDGLKKGFMNQSSYQQTFQGTLAVFKATLINLADMTDALAKQHEHQVKTFEKQCSQLRKELKLASALPKTLTVESTTSVLKTLREATHDNRHALLARLNGGSEHEFTQGPERLAEAQRRRSDRGIAVQQGHTLHGASKKKASRQSTTDSLLSATPSGDSPSGDSLSAADVSGSPPSFIQAHLTQAEPSPPPTVAEWKPKAPSAEPPFAIERHQITEEEIEARLPSMAYTISLFDAELEQEDSSAEAEPTHVGTEQARFKLLDAWSLMTPETSGRRAILHPDPRTSEKSYKPSFLRLSKTVEKLEASKTGRWQTCVNMFTLHPESWVRTSWELTGMIFLCYDFVTVPIQNSFGDLFADSQTTFSLSVVSTTFWTLDMLVSLRTGVLRKDSVVMSPWLIFLNYLKTWMLLDLLLIGLDWGVISSGSSKSAAGSARMLKFLRVFRLLRLRKVMDFISKVEAMSNSNLAVLTLSVFKHVVILVMLNHLIACIWYAVGDSTRGWTLSPSSVIEDTMSYRYLTSLHWSITQFHGTMEVVPTNEHERLLSVVVLVFSMIGNAAFISAVTNKMMQAQHLVQEKTRVEQSFRTFLREHNVSLGLSLRLKKAISNVQTGKQSREAKNELLALIPRNLLVELHMETRGPTILGHLFLRQMNAEYARPMSIVIDQAVQDLHHAVNSDVFHLGEVGKSMFFIIGGDLTYKFYPKLSSSLPPRVFSGSEREVNAECATFGKGDHLSEAPLWVHWVYMGKLTAVTDSSILEVNSEVFSKIVQTSTLFHSDAAEYARTFLSTLEMVDRCGEVITDYFTPPEDLVKRSSSTL